MEWSEGNLSPPEPSSSRFPGELSRRRVAADGDRHPSPGAFMEDMKARYPAGPPERSVPLKICQKHGGAEPLTLSESLV